MCLRSPVSLTVAFPHLKHFRQQADVNGQQYLIIESFRKWKDAQIRSDDAMRQCVNKAEEHINALLKENHRLCEEYRRLFGDYCLLEEENQTVRNAVNSRQTGGAYSPAKVHRGKEVHDDVSVSLSNKIFQTRTTVERFLLIDFISPSPVDDQSLEIFVQHITTYFRAGEGTQCASSRHSQPITRLG